MLSAAVITAAVVACQPSATPTPRETTVEERRVALWLACEECISHELDAVRQSGRLAVPLLETALTGPADTVLRNVARSAAINFALAREQHARLVAQARKARPVPDSLVFVKGIALRFQLSHRTRAALALHLIDPVGASALFRERLREDSLRRTYAFGPTLRRYLDSLSRAP